MPRKQEKNVQFLKLPYVSRINSLLNKGSKVTPKRFKPYQRISSTPVPAIKEVNCSENDAEKTQKTTNLGPVESKFNRNTSSSDKSQSNVSWRKCILSIGKDPFTKSQSLNMDLSNNSPENIGLEVKYECFQLYNNLIENYGLPLSQSYSENLAELYSPCLKLHETCFKDVEPIEPVFPGFEKLVYSPDLDVPNYCEFTEMEVSMLQRMSCGCKPLSWNEFEKMFLIEHVSETKYLNDIDYETTQKEVHAFLDSKDYKDSLKSKKIIISENKFYRHKDSFPTRFEVVDVNENVPPAKTFNDSNLLDDPLAVCGGSNIEMVDKNLVTHNFSPSKNKSDDSNIFEEINLTEDVPGEVELSEFVSVNTGELLALQDRLKSFELHDVPLNILDSPVSSPSPLHIAQPNENIQIDIEGMKISLEEFCTSDLITFPSDDVQEESRPSEEPAIVSSASNCDVDPLNTAQCDQPIQLPESGSAISDSILSSIPSDTSVFLLDSDLGNSMYQSCTLSNENGHVTPGDIIYSGQLESLTSANSQIPIIQIVVSEDQTFS